MIHALILACGNTLRGDDGIGVQIAKSLTAGKSDPDIEIFCQPQWTPELAEPISRAELVIFVDACVTLAPGEVRVLGVDPQPSSTTRMTHVCSPGTLLTLAQELYGTMPRRSVLLTIGGQSFDCSNELSEPVRRALPLALNRIRALISGVSMPSSRLTSQSAGV